MMKKLLVGALFVTGAVGIYLASVFVAYDHKEQIDVAEAETLSREYLRLAANDFEAFSKKLMFPLFDPERLRAELETGAFKQPGGVQVTRMENKIRMGGLDDNSISDVAGTFHCGESKEPKDFRIRFIRNEAIRQWAVMDFVVESCSDLP